jgi:hypothetical protein
VTVCVSSYHAYQAGEWLKMRRASARAIFELLRIHPIGCVEQRSPAEASLQLVDDDTHDEMPRMSAFSTVPR